MCLTVTGYAHTHLNTHTQARTHIKENSEQFPAWKSPKNFKAHAKSKTRKEKRSIKEVYYKIIIKWKSENREFTIKNKYNFKTEPWTCFAIDPHRTLSSLPRFPATCCDLFRSAFTAVAFWCDAQLFRIYRLTQLRLCCRRPIKNRPDVGEASPHCRQMPSTAAGFQISLLRMRNVEATS